MICMRYILQDVADVYNELLLTKYDHQPNLCKALYASMSTQDTSAVAMRMYKI